MSKLLVPILSTALVSLLLGLVVGIAVGVYSTNFGKQLIDAATAFEESADVANPHVITRKNFQLKYPRNWSIDQNIERFDPDQYFSIDSPGRSYVLVNVYPVESLPSVNVQYYVEYFEKVLHVSKKSTFDVWGKYSGVGMVLFGKYVGEPCQVRIFSHSSNVLSFTIAEFFDSATSHQVKPGYDLIEASFTLGSEKPVVLDLEKPVELLSADGLPAQAKRFYELCDLAKQAFDNGNANDAQVYAEELLALAPRFEGDWNYGNAIHHGNMVLGRIAVAEERIEEAKQYPIAAGNTPGSPQLNSFGPNMSLAKDLLEKGESDVVIEYFELCRKFWEMGHVKLENWAKEVELEKTPNFGPNLLY